MRPAGLEHRLAVIEELQDGIGVESSYIDSFARRVGFPSELQYVESRDDRLLTLKSLEGDRGSLCSRFSRKLNPFAINPLTKIDNVPRLSLAISLLDRGKRSRLIPRPGVIASRRHIKLRGGGKSGKKHESNRDEEVEVTLGFHGMEDSRVNFAGKMMMSR